MLACFHLKCGGQVFSRGPPALPGFLTSALFAVGTGFTLEHSGCIQELRPTGLKGHSWLICQMFEGAFEATSTEGSEASLQLLKVKGALKLSKPSKGRRSPFSLRLEGFEAFLPFEASKPPSFSFLKPLKA